MWKTYQEMNQKTYQKKSQNDLKNVPNVMQKRVPKIIKILTKKLPKIDPLITPIPENWDPSFLISFSINLGSHFWSIVESILYLILDSHFGSILIPTPHKMRVPEDILRGSIFDDLECAILEPFFVTFLNVFWAVFGQAWNHKNTHI